MIRLICLLFTALIHTPNTNSAQPYIDCCNIGSAISKHTGRAYALTIHAAAWHPYEAHGWQTCRRPALRPTVHAVGTVVYGLFHSRIAPKLGCRIKACSAIDADPTDRLCRARAWLCVSLLSGSNAVSVFELTISRPWIQLAVEQSGLKSIVTICRIADAAKSPSILTVAFCRVPKPFEPSIQHSFTQSRLADSIAFPR